MGEGTGREGPREASPCTVLFDLGTLRSAADVGGWHKAHRMGVAVGVACFLEEGRFEVYPGRRKGRWAPWWRRCAGPRW